MRKVLRGKIPMPAIPQQFLANSKIAMVICSVITEFTFEEQTAIYLYCSKELSVKDVAVATELDALYIASVLFVFAERLSLLLGVFEKVEKAMGIDIYEKIPIGQLFEHEYMKALQETSFNTKYMDWLTELEHSAI